MKVKPLGKYILCKIEEEKEKGDLILLNEKKEKFIVFEKGDEVSEEINVSDTLILFQYFSKVDLEDNFCLVAEKDVLAVVSTW